MRAFLFFLLLLGGAVAGFVGTLKLLDDRPPDRPLMPVSVDLKFSSRDFMGTAMESGWDKPEKWGVWAKDAEAVAVAQLLGMTRGDVALFIEGRSQSAGSGEQERVTVLVNGERVGVWQLNAAGSADFASFIVPAPLANRQDRMRIAFRSKKPIFGLARLQLRDTNALSVLGGHLDGCQPQRIFGWARAENMPAPIVIRRNGAVVAPVAVRHVTRADLASAGIPAEAGFDIVLPPPDGNPQQVDVSLPNGRPLGNSPCKTS